MGGSRRGRGIALAALLMAAAPAMAGEVPSGEVPSGELPSGALSAKKPPASTLPEATQQALSGVVTRAMTQCDVPGALIGVWTPQGDLESPFGLGHVAKGRPVRLADHFAIRSVTKSFTVTLILQLAAEGRLSLDDKIAQYYEGVPNGDAITLRELADMTSGVFDYVKDDGFIQAFSDNLLKKFTDPELIAFALRHKANFPPGTAYEYSNTNTLLLGQVVEKVTHRSVAKELRTAILRPLRLRQTSYLSGTRIPGPRAQGYQGEANGEPQPIDASFTSLGAAGAMASDLDDLKAWAGALVDGTLLPEKLQAERFVTHPRTNGPDYDAYGLGIGEIDGWWGHTGMGLGFAAAVFRRTDTDSTIVILVNASNVDDVPARILRRFIKILETGSEGPYAGKAICE